MIEKILPTKNTYKVAQNKPKRLDFNNKAFYNSHPDLMPRNNLLLYLERVITKEELDKKFNKTFKPNILQQTKNWLKNSFKNIFNQH